VIHREPTLGQKLLDVAVRKREAQIPAIARRMTSGSNWRHLNRPQTEHARRSIRPTYHGRPAKLQHFRSIRPTYHGRPAKLQHFPLHLLYKAIVDARSSTKLLFDGSSAEIRNEIASFRGRDRRPPRWRCSSLFFDSKEGLIARAHMRACYLDFNCAKYRT